LKPFSFAEVSATIVLFYISRLARSETDSDIYIYIYHFDWDVDTYILATQKVRNWRYSNTKLYKIGILPGR